MNELVMTENGPLKILVAVKDETTQEKQEFALIEETLRGMGYDVFMTSSGFSAIQEMRGGYPLVIADIYMGAMGGIGGLELLQTALSIDEDAQVLIVTDEEHLPETIETLRLGAYDYLLRPINDTSELLNKVENAWATRNLTIQNKRLNEELRISNEKLRKSNQALETAKAEIESWNRELEERVRQRTLELEKANAELRKMDKLKSDFIANVSHEFRTPLTAIRGFTELLLMYPDADKEQISEFSRLIYKDTEKLTRFINQVIEVTELESAGIDWRVDHVYMPDVVNACVDQTRPLADELHVTFIVKIEEPQPIIRAKSDWLQKAVVHLLDNAIKFNKENGQVTVYLRRISRKDGPWLRCEIVDTGIGIAPEDFEIIFERFRQVGDILTSKPQGLGLGLPVAREIIIKHGGEITLKSTVGRGSNFYFYLPIPPETETGA